MIKQSLKLVLIKHSVPKVDPSRSAAAWQLSLEGIERCHRLSTHLAESHPAILVSSHEPKAGATADHLAERLVLPVMSVDGLEEQHRMTVPFLTHNAFQEAIRALFAHPSALVFGEETADAACARFSTVIYQLLDEHRGRSLLVVTHGTVISLFLSRHTGLDPYSLWEQLGLPSFVLLDRQTMHVDKYVMQMSKIVEKGTRPQRSTSRLRSPALG